MEFNFHHIGGRWGTIPPIETWVAFNKFLNITLYEPDPKSNDQIQRLNLKSMNGYAALAVVPYCISSHDGEVDLHMCFDRNTCSIHPFDPIFSEWSFFNKKFDRGMYALGIANTAKEKMRIACNSLDSLVAKGKINQPDALSIDAEGASMDILKGAETVLDKTLALFLESSVVPTRHGEAPFYEAVAYLQKKSFLWVSLGSENRVSMTEMPAGIYDRGVTQALEDSIFLKDPRTVDSPEMLLKLAFAALLCGCSSILHICFEKLDKLNFDFKSAPEALADFHAKYEEVKDLKLPKINETYTETMYNLASYITHASEVSAEAKTDNITHRQNALGKYVPTLQALVNIWRRDGGIYSPLFRKHGLPRFAELSAASEKEQIDFLMRVLRQMGFVKFE